MSKETFLECIDMRITEYWGVEWDEMEAVRDFLQNFYDANDVDQIKIDIKNKTVTVSAPAEFDYKQLVYFYSSKTNNPDAIGQYGEGFKASLLNAMRNWNCNVEMCISNKKLRFFLDDVEIEGTQKKVIKCELSEIEPISGTILIIKNCSPILIAEFQFGLKHFYYEQNPLFGNILLNDYSGDISIRESKEKFGYIFYKKLLRAKIELPIIIICNREYKIIDKQIKHDRDRKAFNEKVTESLLKLIFKQFSFIALKPMVLHLKNWWEKGDKYLAVIAGTQVPSWRNYHYVDYFPENYYARETTGIYPPDGIDELELELKTRDIVEKFKKKNYICCPRYMSYFGMKTPDRVAVDELFSIGENEEKESRSPTLLEHEAIILLSSFCKEISLVLYERYEKAIYKIVTSDKIIGQYKSENYKEKIVLLNKRFFSYQFADAVAIILHEWNHIYGYDGSRIFSDALTELISIILNNKEILNKLPDYEEKWNSFVENIKKERDEKEINVFNLLEKLSNEQLKSVLKEIPENELELLIKKWNFDDI